MRERVRSLEKIRNEKTKDTKVGGVWGYFQWNKTKSGNRKYREK